MTSYKHRNLRSPLVIPLSKWGDLALPVGLTGIQMWKTARWWVVEVRNSQYKKGTYTVARINYSTEEKADRAIETILERIDATYVDMRESLERDAQPILEFLATDPSDPAALDALGLLERYIVLIHDGKVEQCEYSLPETPQDS